jgi:hypothetical protein
MADEAPPSASKFDFEAHCRLAVGKSQQVPALYVAFAVSPIPETWMGDSGGSLLGR